MTHALDVVAIVLVELVAVHVDTAKAERTLAVLDIHEDLLIVDVLGRDDGEFGEDHCAMRVLFAASTVEVDVS